MIQGKMMKEHDKIKEILQTVFDRVNDGIVSLDHKWCYEYINQRAVDMLQKEKAEDLLGKNIWEVYPEGVGQPFYLAYHQAMKTQEPIIFEQHYEPWNQWFENRIYPSKNGITIYFTEITQRKRFEVELRESAALFENTLDAVLITDLEGNITKVNKTFTVITGYEQHEVLAKDVNILSSEKQSSEIYQGIWDDLITKGYWQGEVWNRHKDGHTYPVRLSISSIQNDKNEPSHYLGVFTDISELNKNKAKLEQLAHYDSLTKLPNRLMLQLMLEHSLNVAKREKKSVALLMLDLDHFKDVNDSFGHAAGDELLQQVANKLRCRFRGADTVCRLGGDEFTILIEDISNTNDIDKIASETTQLLKEPWRLSNNFEVRIGASIGISIYPEHGDTYESLLQHADTALYQAKEEGRDRHKFYNNKLTEKIKERLVLESRLRNAIINNELRVYYQPQLDISTMKIIGAEALVRWQDPEEGLIFPDRFISVAEATGLIVDLGDWVLKETCRQGKAWIDEGFPPLTLSVNISSHQFLYNNISQTITDTLQETGFPANKLELELTESSLVEREGEAIRIFNLLHQLGLKIAIDDFGTGYSSLAYLKKFPIDVLKIDKSFVDDIPSSEDDMVIASTIIAMAHTLGLKVIAEGVEDKEQLAFLSNQKCDYFQGYIYSPAVTAAQFEILLNKK
jgi:diguanylate cyclase (GGDEF)-like protein/PAS domain S-box-containing protein